MAKSGKIFLVGISGPSSAGKTTIAHLLRYIFPHVVLILHGDDFSKEFEDLPHVDSQIDGDGPGAIKWDYFIEVLDYLRSHNGQTPPGFSSWQLNEFKDQDKKAMTMASPELLQEMVDKVKASGLDAENASIVLVEGNMLYNMEDIRRRLHSRLFFRLSHDQAKHRRMTRQNYGAEAKEGEFWKTEPYFENMVWRNYKNEHARFFKEGDVEGQVDEKTCKELGVEVLPGMDRDVETILRWAVDAIIRQLSVAS